MYQLRFDVHVHEHVHHTIAYYLGHQLCGMAQWLPTILHHHGFGEACEQIRMEGYLGREYSCCEISVSFHL